MRARFRLTFTVAIAGPILLIVGWTIAAHVQPLAYNSVRDTISTLAAQGATDRWLMTVALYGLGVSYLGTAYLLDRLARSGRLLLALGGLSTLLVASYPQPRSGESHAHTVAATVAFGVLAIWPILAIPRRSPGSSSFRLWSYLASLVMASFVLWFLFDRHGADRGLIERLAAGSESLWPVVAAFFASTWQRARSSPHLDRVFGREQISSESTP